MVTAGFSQGMAGPFAGTRVAPRPAPVQLRSSRGALLVRSGNVKVGDKAPDFSLVDQTGKSVKLSKFQGLFGKPVVLYFYPSDGSPGCTKQAAAFTESFGAFKKAGAVVLGVSGDDVESHVKFIGDQQIPFQLLADEGNEVRQEYGVKKDLLGLLEGRETYVIGKDGIVKMVYNNQFGPESHIEKALEALSA